MVEGRGKDPQREQADDRGNQRTAEVLRESPYKAPVSLVILGSAEARLPVRHLRGDQAQADALTRIEAAKRSESRVYAIATSNMPEPAATQTKRAWISSRGAARGGSREGAYRDEEKG